MSPADGSVPKSKLAIFACLPTLSRGRVFPEEESPTRSIYQRDRDRIIHSGAFRRLKHKTQVFVYHEGDYYRTRLTHSLEVAQIARSLARWLSVDEDLAEALSLAHDLGHTPFGHAGEEALDEAMQPHGGFDHNIQTLRIITSLEARYAEFDGLNLTWETLEGIAKHNGPITGDLPGALDAYNSKHDLELNTWPSIEAQISALSDDIAYHSHDVNDGLRAGLFSIEDLVDVPILGPIISEVRGKYPDLQNSRLFHEIGRRLINLMVNDLLSETSQRLSDANPKSVVDVRQFPGPLVAFSNQLDADNRSLKLFLFERMYRHYRVNRMTSKARRVVADLFKLYVEEPECLPEDWRPGAEGVEKKLRAQHIADYIAGMTDRFALDEHRRLYDVYEVNR
ncbi:MAG: Deoxyguanosinetriphosphate triphosphohydrolase-like protein [Alphaproteobacteria bacterium MarineAlpha11_Bin1]|nr:MAG: Deoxyguanosinetriphosphate triphosphohydrolase-like protein [Alphaproteobacteria bacterium MarineAlpha11_Bin1]|tara:strand:+ start:3961 stop:5145 length:1185 start_codon:yes stop_codon:yes gene_type:complete